MSCRDAGPTNGLTGLDVGAGTFGVASVLLDEASGTSCDSAAPAPRTVPKGNV